MQRRGAPWQSSSAQHVDGDAGLPSCPPQPWPAALPPCPQKRLGRTDPLHPKAFHPARFQQKQRERMALAVTNPADPGGSGSLAAKAAEEAARRRLFVAASSSCTGGLKHVLVSLNAGTANAARLQLQKTKDGDDTQSLYAAVRFGVTLPNPMTDLVAHQLVYGQIKSWELDLLFGCKREPERVRALVDAPINHEPVFGEDRYVLGVSEVFSITCERRIVHFDVGGACPPLELPLTLVPLERAVRFDARRVQKPLRGAPDDSDTIALYAFRTRRPHGYVPGLFFFASVPAAASDGGTDAVLQNAERFLVLDVNCDCFEFVAMACPAAPECAARQARVFDPFDVECAATPSKFGRVPIELPPACRAALSDGCVNTCGDECACVDFQEDAAFLYVPPATTPQQLARFVNGVLDGRALCGDEVYERVGIEVDYDALIDQYVIKSARNCTLRRSLFGNAACGTGTSLNFPLSRKVMLATECSLEQKQRYLQRVLSHVFFFNVQRNVNDRFQVRLECGSNAETAWRTIVVPPACYAARFFVQALERALNQAFAGDAPLFRVRYELFDTEKLVQARVTYAKAQLSALQRGDGHVGGNLFNAANRAVASGLVSGPYRNLTYAIIIEAVDERCLFSLHFDFIAFANLIDFDAHERYELQSAYASRPLSIGCSTPGLQRRWLTHAKEQCGAEANNNNTNDVQCSVCPRRKYDARVDLACGLVTLEQRIQRPFRVRRVASDQFDVLVQVVYDIELVLFCVGDAVLASKTNPLCPPPSLLHNETRNCNAPECAADEQLLIIVGETQHNRFALSFDPFPGCDEWWVWTMPVGFNVHLHRDAPSDDACKSYFDTEKSRALRVVSQNNAVTRYLGFLSPTTRSGAFCYQSDRPPATLVDEALLVRVPELLPLAISEARNTLYAAPSPFDARLSEYYSQLLLDRSSGEYRAGSYTTGSLAQAEAVGAPGSSHVNCLQHMTVQLLRPNGDVYQAQGNNFQLTFELVYQQQ